MTGEVEEAIYGIAIVPERDRLMWPQGTLTLFEPSEPCLES